MSRQIGFKVLKPYGKSWTGPFYPGLKYAPGKVVAPKMQDYQVEAARSSANCAPGVNICKTVSDVIDFIRTDLSDRSLKKTAIFLVSYDTNDILGPRSSFDGKLLNSKKLRLRRARVIKMIVQNLCELRDKGLTTTSNSKLIKKLHAAKKAAKAKK